MVFYFKVLRLLLADQNVQADLVQLIRHAVFVGLFKSSVPGKRFKNLFKFFLVEMLFQFRFLIAFQDFKRNGLFAGGVFPPNDDFKLIGIAFFGFFKRLE